MTVVVKVVSLASAEKVKSGSGKEFTKREVVGDSSGKSRLVLWENDIEWLDLDKCYRLENVGIRMYEYLSLVSCSCIYSIGDIGVISDVDLEEDYSSVSYQCVKGEIVGVVSVEEYLSCFQCKSFVRVISEVYGECVRCKIKVKTERCKKESCEDSFSR